MMTDSGADSGAGSGAGSGHSPDRLNRNGRKLLRGDRSFARWLQATLDLVVVLALFYLHAWWRGMPWDDTEHRLLSFTVALLMIVVYQANGVYSVTSSFLDRIVVLAKSWAIVLALVLFVTFVTKSSATFSRQALLLWSVSGFVCQLLAYLLVRKLLLSALRDRAERIPCLIVGAGPLGRHIARVINDNRWIPDQVVGLVRSNDGEEGEGAETVIGSVEDIEELARSRAIRRVYLALPMAQAELIHPLFMKLTALNVDVIWAPDIFAVDLINHGVRELGGAPVISLSETPLVGVNRLVKAAMDFVIASVAIVLLSPVMLLTALAIKLTSPGPVLFTQKRHGWNGEVIKVHKFRSMFARDFAREGADEAADGQDAQAAQATRKDPRVTAVGRFIRRTSIDELPQLFNVLGGSMSIVGPRPHPVALNRHYQGKIDSYMARHNVKPGLTGLAQVNGHRGNTGDIADMEARVENDLAYIHNWSPWLDIEIILRTVLAVVSGRNAY